MREAIKRAVHGLAWLAVTPSVLSFAIRARLVGRDRALEGSTQAWALVPGLPGQYLRRAFLSRTLKACARTATIEFGTLFSSASASIGERAYVGPRCHLGWAIIEDDALLAAGVHVPSGARTHGIDDLSVPIRDQAVVKTPVRIGRGSWIGSAAVVMADVGCDAVVAAGAVVTRPLPDRTISGGVPARVLRHRDPRFDERLA
ncbi:MAG TPA: DapH/DapD/GlmU-related protein [Vicinamibacterales bacterium]|nr:DapH/DapD/GlmU-related protein [Vicinamibacterales bacterium]